MQEVYLTDLIGTDMLQKMQDSFAKMTGLAALTTDVDGKPVTKGSNFTDYCMKYTRKSKLGCERCEKCDKFGAETTMKTGVSTTYRCHSGLIDFAAPIMAGGQLVGCFIGGQVLTEKPDKEYIKSVADEIGAMELSDMAAELEKAGNEHNVAKIKSDTDALLNKYTEYIDILKPFCEEEKDEVLKDSIEQEQLEELFDKMLKAVDNLDADCMEEVVAEMDRYSYLEEQNECLSELKEAVCNLDVDNCSEIINKWRLILI